MPEKTVAVYLALAPLLLVSGAACWSFILENKFQKLKKWALYIANASLIAALIIATYLFFCLKSGLVWTYWQNMLYCDRSSSSLTVLICALSLVVLQPHPNQQPTNNYTTDISSLLFSVAGLIIASNSRELFSFIIGISTAFWPLTNLLKASMGVSSLKDNLWLTDTMRLKIGSVCCSLYGMALIMLTTHTTTLAKLSLSTEPLFIWSVLMIVIGLGGDLFVACSILHTACKKASTSLYRIKFICIGLTLTLFLFIINFVNSVMAVS